MERKNDTLCFHCFELIFHMCAVILPWMNVARNRSQIHLASISARTFQTKQDHSTGDNDGTYPKYSHGAAILDFLEVIDSPNTSHEQCTLEDGGTNAERHCKIVHGNDLARVANVPNKA